MGVARGHPYSQRGLDGCLSVTIVHFEKADLRVGWELHVSDTRGDLHHLAVLTFPKEREGLPRAAGAGRQHLGPPSPPPRPP